MNQDSPFPLWALLLIYVKADLQCYSDNMRGFKHLAAWIAQPSYPAHHVKGVDYSALYNCNISHLAFILKTDADTILHSFMCEVFPRLMRSTESNV